MKYLCISACQYTDSRGFNVLAKVRDVVEFDEPPFKSLWKPLGEVELDFTLASESELLESTWSFNDAAEVVKEVYDIDLKKTDKPDIVKQILDARYRQVS